MHVAGLHKRVNVSVHEVDRAATPFLSAVGAMPPHAHVQGPKTAAAKPLSSYHNKMDDMSQPWFPWLPWYGRIALIFGGCLLGMYYISTFAWRSALRDVNGNKRLRMLRELGLPTGSVRYMFVGFFHPHSHGGGGGERVLYEAIRHHQVSDPSIVCVVYTGDIEPLDHGVSKEVMLDKVKSLFGIELDPRRITFVPLRNVHLVRDNYWPAFTLAGQAFGANRLAYEAISKLVPDVFIDTAGHAFAYRAVKYFDKRVRVGAYVHYPTISTDMLQRVQQRRSGHTNPSWIAQSMPFTLAKYVYYRIFAAAYGSALRSADAIVCNGNWTRSHIQELIQYRMWRPWNTPLLPPVQVVYPPCQTTQLRALPLENREVRSLLSIAQFRPEKEHEMQLRIVHGLLQKYPKLKSATSSARALRLTLIGSCRNDADRERVASLRMLAKELSIENHIEWCIDAPYELMLDKLSSANIGLSTMIDEHFGISVVEYMAAGLLTLSHASAGPLMDIAVPVNGSETGFHAHTLDEYVDTAYRLIMMPTQSTLRIRQMARERVATMFSDEAFHRRWREHLWNELVPPQLVAERERRRAERTAAIAAAPSGRAQDR